MKHLIYTLLLGAAVVGGIAPVFAQADNKTAKPAEESATDTDAPKPKKKAKGKLNPVVEALSEMDCFNGEPNPRAKFYIYLQSASWCGPCRAEMPKIVAMYPELKKAKVEVILVGYDRTKELAQKYLETFEAPFPGVMREEGKNLPGCELSPGIPYAIMVNSKGKVVQSGHAARIFQNWKEHIKAKPQGKKNAE